jgi:hypothetical protein
MSAPVVAVGTLSGVPVDRLWEWLKASTWAQGVPLTVADPSAIERVRTLLGGRQPVAGASTRRVRTGPGGHRLGAPDHLDPADVHPVRGPGGGRDPHPVHDGGDDRGLPGQAQGVPLSA